MLDVSNTKILLRTLALTVDNVQRLIDKQTEIYEKLNEMERRLAEMEKKCACDDGK